MSNIHAELYNQLRVNLWARHFALGRYWRANHFAEAGNFLGQWPRRNSSEECGSLFERPPVFTSAEELRDNAELEFERWRVMRHDRSNPLDRAGLNLIALCVEHQLGYKGQDCGGGRFSGSPTQMIKIILDTLASLFKFDDTVNPFAGYILRWDPATCDNWSVKVDDKGRDTPQVCCEFLVNGDNKTFDMHHFLYCTPFEDPRYLSLPDKGLLRRWEPSMDEYVGLVMGYFIVFHTFENDASNDTQLIVREVRRQLGLVARYLQHVGYLLVRPNIGFPTNGFTGNGPAGINPCMEYPFSRVFHRVIGDTFSVPASATFGHAIELAGLTRCFASPTRPMDAVNVLRESPVWEDLMNLFGRDPIGALRGFLGTSMPETINLAAHTLLHLDCIDVLHPEEQRWDFALAVLVKAVCRNNPADGFELFMQKPIMEGQFSDLWIPLIGFTALDDSDPVVRNAYLKWYERNIYPDPNGPSDNEVLGTGKWCRMAFSTAVALLLVSDPSQRANYEERLYQELEMMRKTIVSECQSDLFLYEDHVQNMTTGPTVIEANEIRGRSSWGYMAPLALAWLYQLREGRNVFADIPNPSPSDLQTWRSPFVPGEAIHQAHTKGLPIPLRALQTGVFPRQDAGDVDLFYDPPQKPPDDSVGKIPHPPEGVTTHVELVTGPLELRKSQELSIPFPAFNVSGENQNDYVCVMTSRTVISENGLRWLDHRWESDRLVLEVTVERTVRFERGRFVIRQGEFRADYTLAWVYRV